MEKEGEKETVSGETQNLLSQLFLVLITTALKVKIFYLKKMLSYG